MDHEQSHDPLVMNPWTRSKHAKRMLACYSLWVTVYNCRSPGQEQLQDGGLPQTQLTHGLQEARASRHEYECEETAYQIGDQAAHAVNDDCCSLSNRLLLFIPFGVKMLISSSKLLTRKAC